MSTWNDEKHEAAAGALPGSARGTGGFGSTGWN